MKKLLTDFEALKQYCNGDKTEKNEALMWFWKKYDNLIGRMRINLNNRLMKCARISVSREEYFSDIFPTFQHALDKVVIDRIPEGKREKWMFYIQIYGYLRSYNRDYVHGFIKRNKNETSMYRISKNKDEYNIVDIKGSKTISIEAIYEQNQLKCRIENFEKTLPPIQQDIFKYKYYGGLKVDEILKKCNISQTKYSENLKELKSRFMDALSDYRYEFA